MDKHTKQAETFRRIVAPHMNTLYRVARRLTGSSYDAEDLVQELLVKLYPKTDEMQKIELLSPWLKKALYRLFIDEKRKQARRPQGLSDRPDTETGDIKSKNPDPEILAMRAKDRQRLAEALDRLEPENRALVLMHIVEGYSLAELEEVFKTGPETLKTRLRRAKTRLKKILQT